jgi:hypothetical protein
MRGRSNGPRRNGPGRAQHFESNGPDIKVRGSAQQVVEKYLTLAREAATAGDPVMAENYYQHAEHYYRIQAGDRDRTQRQAPSGPNGDGSVEADGEEAEVIQTGRESQPAEIVARVQERVAADSEPQPT